MGIYTYETYKNMEENRAPSGRNERKVGYFSLPDNESSAIVRFAYSSTNEFEFVDVHRVKVDDKFRTIACLRTAKEPLSKCPLCEAGEKRSAKMFVRLLEYTTDEQGKVTVTPKVWERPAFFAKTLESYLREYGDLRDVVFKVVRRGAKGDMKVSYDIMFKNPAMYSEEAGFVKDFSGFDGFELNHHSYMERTFDEMNEILETGTFTKHAPQANNEEIKVTQTQTYPQQTAKYEYTEQKPKVDVSVMGDATMARQPVQEEIPQRRFDSAVGGANDPTVARPRRTYDYK